MVNFWGIFVVLFVCAAFQLAESRIQNDYRSNSLSTSDELVDMSNSLRLSERREALYLFTKNLQIEYSKDYVGKTRDVLNKRILELKALTEKSEDIKERLTKLYATLTDLWAKLYEPVNEPLGVVAALRKVGWIDVGNELSDEMVAITDKFGKAFNQFCGSD